MQLTEDTYKELDKAKKYIPGLEFRVYGNKCHIYIDNKEYNWVTGSDPVVNYHVTGICRGIVLLGKQSSLKKTLTNL